MLAQQLAAEGLRARADFGQRRRRAPASCRRPVAEKQLDQDLMGLGAFWKIGHQPRFRAWPHLLAEPRAGIGAARRVRPVRPESGRAFFEIFFWMFDRTGATVVDTDAVTCPVLCLVGHRRQDRVAA